jgi:hypothetical protein
MKLLAIPRGHSSFPEAVGMFHGLVPMFTNPIRLGIAWRGLQAISGRFESLTTFTIEALHSPVKTGSPPQFRRTGPLCYDKLREIFDRKEVWHS